MSDLNLDGFYDDLDLEPTIPDTIVPYSEVKKHNTKTDCWIVIDGLVYDITKYWQKHPGGKIILEAAGRDGTSLFDNYHPYIDAPYNLPRNILGKVNSAELPKTKSMKP